VQVLRKCDSTHFSPCLLSKRRLTEETTDNKDAIGDIEVRILVLSMDPRFAIR
jgi:hypothetical protein